MPAGGKSPTTLWARLRHIAGIALVAALLVFVIEPWLLGREPLVGRLSESARHDLYDQLSIAAITLMGFLVTAVAILVSLDRTRAIVKELRRGESFSLLVLNLLAAVVALFALSLMSIAGAAETGGAGDACAFLRSFEWLSLIALAETALGGFFFCVVTYKVAAHE